MYDPKAHGRTESDLFTQQLMGVVAFKIIASWCKRKKQHPFSLYLFVCVGIWYLTLLY